MYINPQGIARLKTEKELQQLVGELFIAGVVQWVSAKRWRKLGAR